MRTRELFRAVPMAADTETKIGGTGVGGFLAKTDGALTMTDLNGTVLIDAFPVTGGTYTPLPFRFDGSEGGTVTLSGGASGTLGV